MGQPQAAHVLEQAAMSIAQSEDDDLLLALQEIVGVCRIFRAVVVLPFDDGFGLSEWDFGFWLLTSAPFFR